MSSFFYKALEWARLLFGMAPRSGFGSAKVFLVLHYCFMGLIAIVLAIFSGSIRKYISFLDQPLTLPDWVERIWCGVAFVVVYCIIRIVLYLLELLGIEDDSEFPDIEDDWHEILAALDRERLPIDDVPLFLVNGFTPEQEQSSFEASSNIEWRVIAPPIAQKSAVMRAYANDDAIFLCCTGIGAVNYQQGKVSTERPAANTSGPAAAAGPGVTGTIRAGSLDPATTAPRSATGTNPAGVPMPAVAPAAASPPPPPAPAGGGALGGFFGTIAPGGLQRAMETFASLRSSDVKGHGKKRLARLDEVETMLGIRRMQFLCGLIQESRWPYCPINGMLQGIPFSWSEDQDYAKNLAPSVREDVIAVHEKLQLQFPVVAVITELDDVAGMREFILRAERMQPGLRLSRAGSSFAAGADVSDKNAAWLVERAMQWFRGWVYSAFSHDIQSRDNQKLFAMLCAINQRQAALVTLLRESMYKAVDPRPRLQGCYFCATGRASTEQGFIRGVLDKLPESQGEVAWTPHLKKAKQREGNLSWGFLAGSGLLLIATVMMLLSLKGNG